MFKKMNKYCRCGCNELIKINQQTDKYANYIRGHSSRDRKLSKKHRKRISNSHKGKLYSLETKLKMSNSHKGMVFSDEHKRNISIVRKGKKHSDETKRKIGFARIGNRGNKSPNWQGGISKLPYGFDFNDDLKNLVRKRDNNRCQLCGKHQYKRKHSVHHIDYDKLNNESWNLITLCMACHMRTGGKRQKWMMLFKRMVTKNISLIK